MRRSTGRLAAGPESGGTWRTWLGLAPSMLVIGSFMVVPIGIVAAYSLLEADPYGGVRPALSLEAYQQFLFERDLGGALAFNDAYIRISCAPSPWQARQRCSAS